MSAAAIAAGRRFLPRVRVRSRVLESSQQRRAASALADKGVAVEALGTTPKTAAGARQLYDDWAETYDAALASWEYPAPRRVAETLLEHGVGASASLLDLGCGTGLSGQALRTAGLGGAVTGVDISQTSLDLALSKPGVYSRGLAGSLDDPLPFLRDGEFDAALCVGVLSYVEDFASLFGETARACRPGAVVCMTHRGTQWDEDFRGVRSASQSLVESGAWKLEAVGKPEAYMPQNPDPEFKY